MRTIRTVQPALAPLAAWISSVGAAVALNDLDGDSLPNDVAYVDVRSDEVVVAPVPRTGHRFRPFDLLRALGCSAKATTAPMGVVPHDSDEDGVADLLVYFWGRSPLIYSRAHGSSMNASSYRCRELLQPAEEWYTNAATFADVDGDGHADLVVGNYFPDGARILDPFAKTATAMQDSMSRAFNGGRNRLLLWSADGRFRDASYIFPPHVAHAWTLAIGAQDLDGDLMPELYFANDFGPDRLLHNRSVRGRPSFALIESTRGFIEPRSKVVGRDSFKGMGVDFADVNDDGRPDIFVSNITDPFALEESNFLFVSRGALRYRDDSEPLGVSRGGWGWDARFGDFDNDGDAELLQATGFVRGSINRWPELHELAMSNDTLLHRTESWPRFGPGTDLSGSDPTRFFVRDGARYHDVGAHIGLSEPLVARGIATADVDADGRLDFAIASQWRGSTFFRNVAPRRGNALVLDVKTPVSAAVATTLTQGPPPRHVRASAVIGASVVVRYRDSRGEHRWSGQVDGGNGHSGKRSHQLHIGLGNATRADVEVRWRDRTGRARRHAFPVTAGVYSLLLANRSAS
jgi:hypothetical protein